jgi:hypothetical protein
MTLVNVKQISGFFNCGNSAGSRDLTRTLTNAEDLRDLHDFYKSGVTLLVQNITTPPFLGRYIGKELIGGAGSWS